jgi:hypothetical protein
MDRFQDRGIVVDDEIEDGIEDVVLATRQRAGTALATLAHPGVGCRCAVAHRDEIAFADEQMGLAERDAALDQLRRPRHDEQGIAILLDFRPLMGVIGVLDCEIMQAELSLYPGQQRQVRFVQPDPDNVARLAAPARSFIDGNIGNAATVDVDAGRDDAFGDDRFGRGARQWHNIHGFHPVRCC